MAQTQRITIVQEFCKPCGKNTPHTRTDHLNAGGEVWLTVMECNVCGASSP